MLKLTCYFSLNFWLFIAFGCGIILGNFFPHFATFFFLSFTFAACSYFLYKKNRPTFSDILILFFFLCLGALWQIPASLLKMDRFLNQENICVVKITSLPQDNGSHSVLFADLKEVNGVPFKRRIKVFDYTHSMRYLNSYEVIARLARSQYRNNYFYFLWVKSTSKPKELSLSLWDSWMKKTAQYLLTIAKNNVNDTSYRFLASVFLGRRELLSKNEAGIFRDAGIAHLLAISGSHVALTAGILFFILQLFNVKFRPRLLICLVFLFVYTFITGASPPTLRATLMYSIFALSYFFKRKVCPFNSLGFAGLVCLVIDPSWIFDSGFQLSFISIFALIVGFMVFPLRPSRGVALTYVKYLFFSSLFVSLFLTPLISYYFDRIYLLTIFYNVLLIPFFTFILMLNFLLIIFSPWSHLAQCVGAVISLVIPLFYNLSQWLGSIKFSFINFTFPLYLVYLYYFILTAIFMFALARQKSLTQKRAYGV